MVIDAEHLINLALQSHEFVKREAYSQGILRLNLQFTGG